MNMKILLSHGSGGKASKQLIEDIFLKRFQSKILSRMNDQGKFCVNGQNMAFSTDAYVIDPIFFPGGDIGRLSINGTINDIAMAGAEPLYISVSFIIEEGFSIHDLEKIADSMSIAASERKAEIVTGDTKVVHKGGVDKIFITTSGIGALPHDIHIDAANACAGDNIIINGTIGEHGIAVLSCRDGLTFDTDIVSDTAPLSGLVSDVISACRDVHVMRDPTRGGVASTLNEIAERSNVGIDIYEERIPVKEEVKGACEMLGLDPLYVANEGKLVMFVPDNRTDHILEVMRRHKYGKNSAIIGKVVDRHIGRVCLHTAIGGTRIVDMLIGDQLPRIC